MFFLHRKPTVLTYDQRIASLKDFGLSTQTEGGAVRVTRGSLAAVVEKDAGGMPKVKHSGLVIGKEIGMLVDGGFQKFWRTESGVKEPALADQLRELHAFEEDLREGLGLTSLFNEALGTTFNQHMYDRVRDRDKGTPAKPWEKVKLATKS